MKLKINRRRFFEILGAALVPIAFSHRLKAKTSKIQEANPKIYYVALTGNDANPGSQEKPWATITKAAQTLKAGETVYIRGGNYSLYKPIVPKNSGSENQWITYAAYPQEEVIINAEKIYVGPPVGKPPFPHDEGAFQVEDKSYIRLKNLRLINSYNSGFRIKNSHHIELYNNTTQKTFAPGIFVYRSQDIKVMGNTVIKANTNEMRLYGDFKKEAPHEGISIASGQNFEVAYNHLFNCDKEAIDCKESSAQGIVHHNYVHNCPRQGIYIDAWGTVLEKIEVYENVIHDCETGIAISAEGGLLVDQIRIHHNLIYNNRGTGIFFSRWGKDNLRKNIFIYNNTVYHNGYGRGNCQEPYWLTGGLYLYTTNLENIVIQNNIFSENKYFQIGYSGNYKPEDFERKNLKIEYNLIHNSEPVTYPVYLKEWAKDYVFATQGKNALEADPLFVNARIGNLYLKSSSPAIKAGHPENSLPPKDIDQDLGALPANKAESFWWRQNFPPKFDNS
ncbi:right-handed parallel beta-helix repeat-containing protein [Gloeothece verrucosa]|uniref:Right handed beta helix domain-containing protein n=1 Tax=Gloeothece verrucosa (strain PCC 7822) TaxID=497965 RepID=E0UDQ8_GLOV7|nr:right-handed parallel beta-helix repeat-containing protein [Gloeothece verrucosa]ADN16493.1 protein of unknown function DUF1565 [Gloeothece verrucosa PCC 7822]